jgi:hypothetical protein
MGLSCRGILDRRGDQGQKLPLDRILAGERVLALVLEGGSANNSGLVRRNRYHRPETGNSLSGVGRSAVIKELDPVVLTESQPEEGLEAGDVGWVVMVHGDGAGYEVEFVTLTGETNSVVTVPAHAVRAVGQKEIARARMIA